MNLSTALKAAHQLGFTQTALNALYRFGLATGHYRRAIRPPTPIHDLQLQPLFLLPAREQLLAILGESGLQTLLAEADEIVSGKFRQFGGDPVEIQLTPPPPLQHWTEYMIPQQSGVDETHPAPLSTLSSPFSDIKLTWEPARFGWAFTLGRAYHLSGDEKYAAAFWRYFESFQNANPPYMGPNWISGQEVGLRLMAFTWAGQVFAKAAESSPARLAALAAATAVHAARIPATLLYARSQNNNHLLTEAAALYTAGLALPDHPDAPQWQKTGQKWLVWCFTHQIDAYGEYVQHSSNYQRLMLQTALWVFALVENREIFDSASKENLALATHWLFSLLDPESGHVPNLGANDGAYIFPLSSLPFNDFRPVVQAAARAFLGLTLPPGIWDETSLWFGLPLAENQMEIPRYPGDQIIAKNSWGYLRAVKYKSRPSHADQLHFDLWWRGLNIAQDAGTYLYNADPPWDNQLTSTLVHNTVSVDGLEQMTRVSRFLYLGWADATSRQHFETGSTYLQRKSARTYAYAKVNVRHDRTVTVFDDDRWLVEDDLLNVVMPGKAPLAHVYRLHWLLPDWEWKLESREERIEISLKSPHGWVRLEITPEPANLGLSTGLVRAGELLYGERQVAPVDGWVSPTYSIKKPALSLAVEVQSSESVKFNSEFIFPSP